MQGIIDRHLAGTVKRRLQNNPAVAILGPRQCGKTTLAGQIVKKFNQSVYLDLENPGDLAKLSDPLAFFSLHSDDLVCLDEIQRAPELFSTLRSIIDERARNAQFLILGSAGRDLIRQSSESLAGRIAYLDLTPFLISELRPRRRTISGGSGLEAGSPGVISRKTSISVSNGGRTSSELSLSGILGCSDSAYRRPDLAAFGKCVPTFTVLY